MKSGFLFVPFQILYDYNKVSKNKTVIFDVHVQDAKAIVVFHRQYAGYNIIRSVGQRKYVYALFY